MQDVNCMLENAASMWRAQAYNLEQAAAVSDAEAAGLDARAPGLGMGDPYRADATAGRAQAAWLRRRAEFADKGQYLFDPRRLPAGSEMGLQAAAARSGRLVSGDPAAIAGVVLDT